MTWLQRHRLWYFVSSSLWLLPLAGIVLAILSARLMSRLDQELGWVSGVEVETARLVLGTLGSAMFTFIVFVSSALLVAVQLASAQLTPRVIAFLFRDPVTKFALTLFVFAFTFILTVLIRIGTSVPLLTTHLAAYSGVVSLAVFLYLIDHVGRFLRPSGALLSVARTARGVIEAVYPRLLSEPADTAGAAEGGLLGKPSRTVAADRDGVVLAFDVAGLVDLARRAECVLEMVPQVGDFVAAGQPLFRIYRGGAGGPAEVLCQSVALGQERTLEQDPAFAFRILVDIASKGLSPGINDPTTAVLALDQIHHLLHSVGSRHLDHGHARDSAGRVRLLYRTPDWGDFVHLAVTEVRHYGGESIQVARRLRAMLEDLIATLPPERGVLLRQELNLLHRAAERFFTDPEDRALADVSDFQGVGGKHGPESPADLAGRATSTSGALP